jgi:hypothetical protein
MRKLFYIILIGVVAVVLALWGRSPKVTIQKYDIEIPQELVDASGGFQPAIGSGIEFVKEHENGDLEFKAITDRGPNYPLKDDKAIVSFHPNFSPKIATVMVTPNKKARVTDFTDIKRQNIPISGWYELYSGTGLIVDQYQQTHKATFGLDTESIAILDESRFVVGDEYYPSINIIDRASGNILESLTPGNGLPEVLKFRRINRGFESVACYGGNKIYASLEGTIGIDDTTAKTAKLIRIIEIDLKTRKTKTYAYKFDYDAYVDSSKVKIGDMAVVNDGKLLLVEQGPTVDGKYRNMIYEVDLKNATDISDKTLSDGRELELGTLTDLDQINFATKKLIFNAREHGWPYKKLEGLTVINKHTIAITNDNDFGIDNIEGKPCLTDNSAHKCERIKPVLDGQRTQLWIVKLS